jgi:predicted transcriptional regulator
VNPRHSPLRALLSESQRQQRVFTVIADQLRSQQDLLTTLPMTEADVLRALNRLVSVGLVEKIKVPPLRHRGGHWPAHYRRRAA